MASSFSKPSTYTVVVKLLLPVRNVAVAVGNVDVDAFDNNDDGNRVFAGSGENVVKLKRLLNKGFCVRGGSVADR